MVTPVVLIAGPTASGKSGLALRLAQAHDGVIINADSMQVYAELQILSARPSAEEETLAPHRLYGVVSAAERFSVGKWLRAAQGEIAMARKSGRPVFVVGGTGLYFQALQQGLSPIPDIPEDVRRQGAELLADLGTAEFHRALAAIDPAAAARISTGDSQRMQRAYEVMLATGRSLLQWHADSQVDSQIDLGAQGLLPPVCPVVLVPERAGLYRRIDARLWQMMDAGAMAEIEALAARGLSPDMPAMKALGVPDLLAHLRGEISLEDAVAAAQQASRRYAKRQFTWINNKMIAWNRFELEENDKNIDRFVHFISQFLLTSSN